MFYLQGCFGQSVVYKENTFTRHKNDMLKKKKRWNDIQLKPFEFPHNNRYNFITDNNEFNTSLPFIDRSATDKIDKRRVEKQILKTNSYGASSSTSVYDDYDDDDDDDDDDEDLDVSENVDTPTTTTHTKEGPANWKDLKENYTDKFHELLSLSNYQSNLPYYLQPEEAFFLSYTLECLEIRDVNNLKMNEFDCWKQFNHLKTNFPFYYAAYHYYRSKGWVVKPGEQYGGDYGNLKIFLLTICFTKVLMYFFSAV